MIHSPPSAFIAAPAQGRPAPVAAGPAARGLPLVRTAALVVVSLATAGMLLHAAELGVDPRSRSNLPFIVAGLATLALRAAAVQLGGRVWRSLADCAGYYALFTGMALLGAVASYPIAALTHGYADAALERADVALGFDWLAWYRAVAEHPALQRLGVAAYESIYLSPAVLLGWFAWHGDRREAHRFLLGFWTAAVLTLGLFSLMPAVGPFSFLWRGPIPYMPSSELWQPDLIPQLRAHLVHVIDLGQLRGLVSAPSFHTAAATLYIGTAWRVPALRWPLLALNALMLLATPVEGTHYLTDMIIGAAVAMVAMTMVRAAMARGAVERGHALRTISAA